jgi:hypothetical protein
MIAKLSNNQVGWKDNILVQKEMNVNIDGEAMLEFNLSRYSIAQWCRCWYFLPSNCQPSLVLSVIVGIFTNTEQS